MAKSSIRILVLLTFVGGASLELTHCDRGWFGAQCQYKCRCTENKCTPDGLCGSGSSKCQRGWFGPQCQYVDLVATESVDNGDPSYKTLSDGDGKTCFSKTYDSDAVSVDIARPFHFTWLRLHLRDPYYVNEFTVQFKKDEGLQTFNCQNLKVIEVTDITVDIHCDVNPLVTRVIIAGRGVRSICSLYISGGRNVAIGGITKQSSYYTLPSHGPWNSSLAVDGNTDGDFYKDSCMHTKPGDKNPNWSLTFTHQVAVNRFVLYNRLDKKGRFTHRLQGFILRGYNKNDKEIFNIKDNREDPQDVYVVQLLNSRSDVVMVTVEATEPEHDRNGKILTLCEFQAFGDYVCNPGFWGPECENICYCSELNNPCFVSNGACSSG